MSFARFSTDDVHGKIRGYTGGGRFTDDPLETFGGAGVVEIPGLQKLLRYICDNVSSTTSPPASRVSRPSSRKPPRATSIGRCTPTTGENHA
jgi:L-fucose isomerase, C-terminal domain